MTRLSSIRFLFLSLIVLATGCERETGYRPQLPQGDAQLGRAVLTRYECGVCHVIPGVRGAMGQVGPSLEQYRRHVYVAGKFPNVPEVLVRFLMDPPAMAPRTAMPDVGVSETDAWHMAAYLYSLE